MKLQEESPLTLKCVSMVKSGMINQKHINKTGLNMNITLPSLKTDWSRNQRVKIETSANMLS